MVLLSVCSILLNMEGKKYSKMTFNYSDSKNDLKLV